LYRKDIETGYLDYRMKFFKKINERKEKEIGLTLNHLIFILETVSHGFFNF